MDQSDCATNDMKSFCKHMHVHNERHRIPLIVKINTHQHNDTTIKETV